MSASALPSGLQHVFVIAAHHRSDRLAGADMLCHFILARHDPLRGIEHATDIGSGDEDHRTFVGHDVVTGRDSALQPTVTGHICRLFDDTAARGQRRQCSGRTRKLHFDRLIDIAGRTFDDDASNPARLRADGKEAAPASGFDAGALFHDNYIVGPAALDGRGAKMARRSTGSGPLTELDRDDLSRDPARPGLLRQAR